ncbi:FAD-dependent oxidoreductase [Oscillibacter sp.]|uniref:FAD-dependent oxidoreductase n=1 Tax=Oscillibacter sp. TaxID=1945593 RepID=UPI002628EB62|nr:FAD-dependent oxidoreductase [Oscillibacter sp.]MDD3347827.1 FAD-dependent oxidoreductase [Oscillibacter sp.]
MAFLWTAGLTPPSFPSLSGNFQTDVLIIGGGMAGVLCAKKLQDAGVDTVLVEGKTIGHGITKGTTAVLTAQHDTLYQDMLQSSGSEKAGLYLRANLHAVQQFRHLSREIDCDFEEKPSIMYSLNDRAKMEREAKVLATLGFQADFLTETPMPFPVAGAVRYPGMAQFHPLKFLYGISRGLPIFENTFVDKLDETTALTKNGSIRAKKIIVATHYPFLNSHGLYFMKLYQKRSHVIAFENAPDLGCTIEDVGENGFYLRNYNDLLLIGGGDHRTGKQGGSFRAVREFAARNFPKAREKYVWANQDCVSLDGIPYIGPYSPGLENVYVASGFNLWGMTTSMIASDILTDAVLGRKNPYAEAFDPGRSILRGQLLANMGTTLADFLTPTAKRCSHLGCALKWNSAEHSWDCPCHGSRFDAHGRLIDNPAMRDSHVE